MRNETSPKFCELSTFLKAADEDKNERDETEMFEFLRVRYSKDISYEIC